MPPTRYKANRLSFNKLIHSTYVETFSKVEFIYEASFKSDFCQFINKQKLGNIPFSRHS